MGAALSQLGFTVTMLRDADLRTMQEAIEVFLRQLRQGGVGLFYFAGHGMQVHGENYLIPLHARINREQDVPYEAVPVGRILGGMEDANNQLNIIILDACRDNPYLRQWRSSQHGLAVTQAARGSLIAFATSPGSVASDGSGRNGVYTFHLLKYLSTPDLSVEQLFKKVRRGVVEATKGLQTPWESSSLIGDFAFAPEAPSALTPTQEIRGKSESTPRERDSVAVPGATLHGQNWPQPLTVRPFRIDLHPVTNREFLDFVKAKPHWKKSQLNRKLHNGDYLKHWPNDETIKPEELEQPVNYVNYSAAEEYCKFQGKKVPALTHYRVATRFDEGQTFNIQYDAPYTAVDLHFVQQEWTNSWWGKPYAAPDPGKRLKYQYGATHSSNPQSRDYTPGEDPRYAGRFLGFRCANY